MAIGEVTVSLGGVEHTLWCRLKAWGAMEDHGLKFQQVIDKLNAGNLEFKELHVLLWACLQHEKPPPSFDEVGDWVGGENIVDVIAKIGEVLRGAFPEQENPPMPGPASPGTGTGPEA